MNLNVRRPARLAIAGALVIAGPVALAACGDDSSSSSDDATTTTTMATGVTVTGAWARTSPMSADTGAVYLTLTSSAADALTGVAVDPSVAGEAQLHETVTGGMGDTSTTAMMGDTSTTAMMGDTSTTAMMGDTSTTAMGDTSTTTAMGDTSTTAMGSGQMSMREIDKLDLPAGKAITLKPGGYHIMLMKLAKPLEKGSTIKVTLTFATAASQTVDVPVRDEAP